jgi:hypothetical protein
VQDVLVVCPQARDRSLIAAAGLDRRYRVRYVGEDLDALERLDAPSVLEACLHGPADGVVGTKDRSALLAAVVAARRGLPGPRPEVVAAIQHKPTARRRSREAVPEATPRFFVPAAERPPFPPPYFVKPAVGRLSQGARPVDALDDLGPPGDGYADGWAGLAALAAAEPPGASEGWIVEELVTGDEVTLEGFVHRGQVTVVGVTDSLKYPGTNSFEAFAYPSDLPDERDAELRAVATRLLPALDFDDGFFNVEFFVPERGPAKVIEVNARIASQFEPLVRALHGRSTYDALFRLACGGDPHWDPARPDGAAVSYVLRTFDDAFAAAVPEPEPALEVLVAPGRRLSEQSGSNDVASYRLAIVVETGETREEALGRARERARRLSFELLPAPPR